MIRLIKRTINNPRENVSAIMVEIIIFKKFGIDGLANIINIDNIKHANPKIISIRAVKYFEFINCFFVTGSVCVR